MEQHYWNDYENPKCSELAILEDCVKETHPSCIDLFQRQAEIHYGPVLQYPHTSPRSLAGGLVVHPKPKFFAG